MAKRSKKDFKLDLTPLAEPKEEINWLSAQKYLEEVSWYYGKFAGKSGYNPYKYMNNKVVPLALRYDKGERTPELHKAIMALEKIEPKI